MKGIVNYRNMASIFYFLRSLVFKKKVWFLTSLPSGFLYERKNFGYPSLCSCPFFFQKIHFFSSSSPFFFFKCPPPLCFYLFSFYILFFFENWLAPPMLLPGSQGFIKSAFNGRRDSPSGAGPGVVQVGHGVIARHGAGGEVRTLQQTAWVVKAERPMHAQRYGWPI